MLWGGFPYVFQAALLAVFIALAWISWGVFAPAGVPDKLFAKPNNQFVHYRQVPAFEIQVPGKMRLNSTASPVVRDGEACPGLWSIEEIDGLKIL